MGSVGSVGSLGSIGCNILILVVLFPNPKENGILLPYLLINTFSAHPNYQLSIINYQLFLVFD